MNGGRTAPALLFAVLASFGVHLALLGLDAGSASPSVGATLPVVLVATAPEPPATAAPASPAPPATPSAFKRMMRTSRATPPGPPPARGEKRSPEPPRTGAAAPSAAARQPEAVGGGNVEREALEVASSPGMACPADVARATGQESVAEDAGQSVVPGEAVADSTAGRSAAVAGPTPSLQIAPRYRFAPPPPYPALARSRGWQGDVELWVRVAEDGRVLDARVQGSSGFELLDRAAVAAVGRWRFHPGRIGQTPVTTEIRVPVCFRLSH